ncbi:nuclear membrane protein [Ephemerocybe angulata]|uniref:Nuclear membrane protein n=1 Tax=Ephemerocybe angulata TaxID=980116 RepID=A0A8H6II78_9AGAR|nr:nuclear membrane protein [Tulosesus angulatus]
MDYEWTHRPETKPAWSNTPDAPSTPQRKRTFGDVNPSTPSFTNPGTPTFGRNQNVPFLFNTAPVPSTPQRPDWSVPSRTDPQPEIHDIDMNEVTPSKPETKEEEKEEEEEEAEPARPIALGGLRRVFKQRKTRRGRSRRLEDREESSPASSEGEDEDQVALRPRKTSNHFTLNMPAPARTPSETPYLLLGYLQFFFNLSLILLFLYLVVQFILTVQRDVEKRISEYSQDIVQDIAVCASQYKSNYCNTQYIGTAMMQQCANWETCMNRDPTTIGRAKVSAELIAEVINGFVEPISWKTLLFTLTSLGFLTVFINALLSLYRSKYQPIPAPLQPSNSFPILPASSYPPHHFGGYMSPAPSDWRRMSREDEDTESPTRRRRLEGGIAAKIK